MRYLQILILGAGAVGFQAAHAREGTSTFAPPVRLEAGGKPINVDTGHAAPCFADIDGDGSPELLVGQFDDGKLRVYPNRGTRAAPRFDTFAWFQAGGKEGKVPAG